jgi:uncharacterized membrane protein
MGHSHDHSAGDAAISARARRVVTAVAVALGVLTLVGLAVLWPRHDPHGHVKHLHAVSDVYGATTISVHHGTCGTAGGDTSQRCTRIRFRLDQGPDRGQFRSIEFAQTASAPDVRPGDKVVLNHIEGATRGFDYSYNDRQRRTVLLWLAVIFAVVVIALGRWRGVTALVALGASIAVILAFILPSMLDGNNAQIVAVVGASAVAFVALYISNGLRPLTTVALLGTLSALALTVVLATVFTDLAHFTGAQNEDALLVSIGTSTVNLKSLVLAGMVLGALGALNDITVTQAAAVGELRLHNPTMSRRTLYRSGLKIGRDHISSTVNTLALAYAGASLPLLMLFTLSAQSLGTVANGEIVAVEIVATLVGSIGLVAAVPVSTALAVLVASDQTGARPSGRTRRRRPTPRDRRPPEPVEEEHGTARESPEPPERDLLAPVDRDFWP